jgi:ribose 5-phosphate isomerase B
LFICFSLSSEKIKILSKGLKKYMKVAIGADHAGFEAKEKIKKQLDEMNIAYEDLGTNSLDSVDYPDFGAKVGREVGSGKVDEGIVVCGSGIGIAIAANKVHGVRAAQAWNEETARLAREHNDANVLSIGARVLPEEEIPKIVRAWFDAKFEGGRHAGRVAKISELENEND